MGYYEWESVDGNQYNRFVNLDNIEFRIIDFLAKSDNKYASYLFKILKYDTEDCLSKTDLTYAERMALLYKNNGDASTERIFMAPYVDDAFDVQSSHLHVFVESVVPTTHLSATVNVGIQCIVHNKISNVYGDAGMYNPQTNPSEMDGTNPMIIYKSRASVMLKCVLAALNGTYVDGVGTLQFNVKLNDRESAKMTLWNGKKFFGYEAVISTIISGMSETPNCGY